MFEKAKNFYNEHKKEIIVIGGTVLVVGTGILIGKTMGSDKQSIVKDIINLDESKERAILEGIGAVYKEGYSIPFATKDVAMKFLEERGKTYQLDILDGLNRGGVIWISE